MPPGTLYRLLAEARARTDGLPQPIVPEVTVPLPRPPRLFVIGVSCAVTLLLGFTVIALV